MATKSQVLAAARRAWGKKCQLAERRGALPKARREALVAEIKALQAEKNALPRSAPTVAAWRSLIDAARFVVDVNGDHPSISRLAAALAGSEAVRDAMDHRASLEAVIQRLRRLGPYAMRFYIYENESAAGLPMSLQHAEADTLGELLERIRVESEKEAAGRADRARRRAAVS
jgi:hypothetical protein